MHTVDQLLAQAEHLLSGRRWDMAEPILLRALAAEPRHAGALDGYSLWTAGLVALDGSRDEDALALLSSAVEREPLEGRFHQSLASVYLRKGKLVEATEHLKEARRLDPTLPLAQLMLMEMERRRPPTARGFYPPTVPYSKPAPREGGAR